MCDHTLGPLVCTGQGHPYGHTYESTSGIPDHHSLTSGE